MKEKMEFWRDEMSSLRPGMRMRSWRMDQNLLGSDPTMDVETVSPGLLVLRIDRRTRDGHLRVALSHDGESVSFMTGWMAPSYPVFMGAPSSLSDRVRVAWWRVSDRARAFVSSVRRKP